MAYKDIAFEFASAISPVFKLYLIKEFERLKQLENQNREWDIKRILTQNNYLIHTDAIKKYILLDNDFYKNKEWLKYAEEADILNVIIFKTTAKKGRELNPDLAKNSNVKDYATINELTVLSNFESHNAELIKEGKSKEDDFQESLDAMRIIEGRNKIILHNNNCIIETIAFYEHILLNDIIRPFLFNRNFDEYPEIKSIVIDRLNFMDRFKIVCKIAKIYNLEKFKKFDDYIKLRNNVAHNLSSITDVNMQTKESQVFFAGEEISWNQYCKLVGQCVLVQYNLIYPEIDSKYISFFKTGFNMDLLDYVNEEQKYIKTDKKDK